MTVGENIKRIRKEKGLTQKKLGELCGINEVQIRRYELGGKNSNPKIETLKRIADALDTPLILFVEDDLLDAATLTDGDSEEELIDKKINEIMNNTELSLEEKKAKAKELMIQLEIVANYHSDNSNRLYEYMIDKLIAQLNYTGKDKALEHIEMLTKIPEYRQDTNPEKE